MSGKLNVVVLDRCDPSQNVSRFYVLRIEPSLFGDPILVRERGRIGQHDRQRIEVHQTQERAAEALESWLRRKQRRGYRVRGS
ncbi:polymerase [Microvirga sp. KLBC 81]|uniref:WGR domain-containing protein n=1 Tax=Microvirga sp. KLBC 81 TaxID=1862707 RepID=UPI000D50CD1F|nr:WGR domain-containing protein [Microvirga sp. KLBC 81]PVE23447.1 polymerase [Microvirga sp. KLBC 81]